MKPYTPPPAEATQGASLFWGGVARVDIVKALTTPCNLTHPRTRALSYPPTPSRTLTHRRTTPPTPPIHPHITGASAALRVTLYSEILSYI